MNSLYLYEVVECGHECADYVATIDFHASCASTLTNSGFERLAMWDDMDEVLAWAANVHGIDPWDAILVDPDTGRTVHFLR